ncbi:MAG TPA: enoyl-CoA hydratase-related protein [Actinomycetota bacterium]|nr:enoyl-CoA hydratase-related protein [Actinomycetota bacterium]
MPAPKLLIERRAAVTVLTINRPEVRNCVDAETADLLTDAIEDFAAGDDRVLVVTGTGDRAFCAGADLKAVEGLMRRPGAARTGPLGFSGLDPGKPTIAAVEGYCVGGGLELACWCDFRVAGEGAVFGALNRRVGVPWVDGGTQRLPRTVGMGNALYLIETGERIDARRGLEIGLVQEVVPAGSALGRAVELAERIAAWPQVSLRSDRRATSGSWGRTLGEGLAFEAEIGRAAALDEELTEGARTFVERGAAGESGEGGAADALHP